MPNKTVISCSVTASGPGLTFTARLDDDLIWSGDPVGHHNLSAEISDDDDRSHSLIFEMSGKTAAHTQLDDAGTIVKDLTVTIQDVRFDEIMLGQIFLDKAVYEHDFNGTQPRVKDQFFGIMGCNGTITLEFATPVYLWLLENM